MTRRDRQVAIARHAALQQALKILERDALRFAAVQVRIAEASDLFVKQLTDESKRLGTAARMEHVEKLLDIRAAAYLELVTDLETQKAYETLIGEFLRGSWEQFTGFPFEAVPPFDDQISVLRQRARHWTVEGYRKISIVEMSSPSEGPGPDLESYREKMLAEYKAATGNPSNKKIYEARNSGIHKPQFYEWVAGTLPSTSVTAINFEAFLKLKRPPIPKK